MSRIWSLLIVLGILSQSCGPQTENSFSQDELYFGTTITGSAEFIEVILIIQSECAECHAEYLGIAEGDWATSGYVTAGSPATSLLYNKIRGTNSGGDENMPPSSTLTSDQINAISTWITGL